MPRRALRTSAPVASCRPDQTRAAIPAAWGAAALVPQKSVENDPAPVTRTPSTPEQSGFCRVAARGAMIVTGPRDE